MKSSITSGTQTCIFKKKPLKEKEKIWNRLISSSSKLTCKDMFKEKDPITDLNMIISFKSIILSNFMILHKTIKINNKIPFLNIHQIIMKWLKFKKQIILTRKHSKIWKNRKVYYKIKKKSNRNSKEIPTKYIWSLNKFHKN
jgi:hypothetical protein